MSSTSHRAEARDHWVTATRARQLAEDLPLVRADVLAERWDDAVPRQPVSGYWLFHRQPLLHQLRDFYRFRDGDAFALFYEQRAGKSKVVLDVFQYRYEHGDVDALIVLAYPNGVHFVWIDEIAKDFPPDLLAQTRAIGWQSGKMANGQRRLDTLALRDHPGPAILTMNCEALITEKGWGYLDWFLKKRRAFVDADEASWAGNFSARTRKLEALGRRPNAVIRAINDGTPTDESPGELYHPCRFLSPTLLGFATKDAFRARYFAYEEEEDPDNPGLRRRVTRERWAGGKRVSTYQVQTGYRNLDELAARLRPFSSRVTRADISDAPEKIYQKRPFELTPKQRDVYDRLRETYLAELSDGREVRAADVLLRMTRLSMVSRNYYPPERVGVACAECGGAGASARGDECPDCFGLGIVVGETPLTRIDPERNPAMDALLAEVRATRGAVVVWCRFRQEVADVVAVLVAAGKAVHRYDGGVPPEKREAAYQAFRAGDGDAIVGTILSGLSRGKDLKRAIALIYYSSEFSLRARRQSEDRAEGLERTFGTGVVDLVARDTRDEDVLAALRAKRSVAAAVMGDELKEWI